MVAPQQLTVLWHRSLVCRELQQSLTQSQGSLSDLLRALRSRRLQRLPCALELDAPLELGIARRATCEDQRVDVALCTLCASALGLARLDRVRELQHSTGLLTRAYGLQARIAPPWMDGHSMRGR